MSKYQKKNSKKETTTTTKILEIDLRSWRQNIVAVFRLRKQVIANLWNLMPGFVFSSRKYNLVNFRNKKDIDIFCANKNEPRSIWLWWKKAGITCPLICDDVLKLWGQFKFGGGGRAFKCGFFFSNFNKIYFDKQICTRKSWKDHLNHPLLGKMQFTRLRLVLI